MVLVPTRTQCLRRGGPSLWHSEVSHVQASGRRQGDEGVRGRSEPAIRSVWPTPLARNVGVRGNIPFSTITGGQPVAFLTPEEVGGEGGERWSVPVVTRSAPVQRIDMDCGHLRALTSWLLGSIWQAPSSRRSASVEVVARRGRTRRQSLDCQRHSSLVLIHTEEPSPKLQHCNRAFCRRQAHLQAGTRTRRTHQDNDGGTVKDGRQRLQNLYRLDPRTARHKGSFRASCRGLRR